MQGEKRILLIDDDPDMTELLLDILSSEGYNAIVADSRRKAEEFLTDQRFDLVMLDLTLPDGDGLELCRKACGDDSTVGVPVFVLSGKTAMETKLKSFLCGAKRYFTKPFNVEELLDAVRIILSPNRTPHSAPV